MIEWGHRHEPAIVQKYAEETGATIIDPGEYTIHRRGVLFATVDRFQELPGYKGRGVLELKCAWYDAFKEWQHKIPVAYQIQLQQQLYCTGCEYGAIAVLGNGYMFRYFHFTRNEKFINRLVERLTEWWKTHVIGGVEPKTDGHVATTQALGDVYQSDGSTIDIEDHDVIQAAADYDRLGGEIKRLTAERDAAANMVKATLGEAEKGTLPGGDGFSWKPNAKGTRTLRRTK